MSAYLSYAVFSGASRQRGHQLVMAAEERRMDQDLLFSALQPTFSSLKTFQAAVLLGDLFENKENQFGKSRNPGKPFRKTWKFAKHRD